MTILTPRENSNLIGHEAAERELLMAWRSGRLPHGWLIHGPRGIGKATLAFRFARFVLADGAAVGPNSIGIDADDPLFRRVASGGHSDLMALERTYDIERKRMRSVIVVDDVRAAGRFLSAKISLTSLSGTALRSMYRQGRLQGWTAWLGPPAGVSTQSP